jgi:hypothetical protein
VNIKNQNTAGVKEIINIGSSSDNETVRPASPHSTKKPLPYKRIVKKRIIKPGEAELMNIMKKAFEKDLEEKDTVDKMDDIDIFLLHIGRQLKAIPDKKQQLLVQNQLQQVLFNYQLGLMNTDKGVGTNVYRNEPYIPTPAMYTAYPDFTWPSTSGQARQQYDSSNTLAKTATMQSGEQQFPTYGPRPQDGGSTESLSSGFDSDNHSSQSQHEVVYSGSKTFMQL